LIEHIESTHHVFLRDTLPQLSQLTEKITSPTNCFTSWSMIPSPMSISKTTSSSPACCWKVHRHDPHFRQPDTALPDRVPSPA
jgi:hypothetical protein